MPFRLARPPSAGSRASGRHALSSPARRCPRRRRSRSPARSPSRFVLPLEALAEPAAPRERTATSTASPAGRRPGCAGRASRSPRSTRELLARAPPSPSPTSSSWAATATGRSRCSRTSSTTTSSSPTTSDGRPLDGGHGAPLRLVSPGQYGFIDTKHLCRIELLTAEPATCVGTASAQAHVGLRLFGYKRFVRGARLGAGASPLPPPRLVREISWRLLPALRRLSIPSDA